MNKIVVAVIGVLVVLLITAGLVARAQHQRADKATEKAEQYQRKADELQATLGRIQAVSNQRAKALRKLQEDTDTSKQGVRSALDNNPDWSNSRIPDGVYDSLPGPKAP